MTDADLVAKKLAFIETCVADLRHHANLDVLADDIQQQRFVLHTLHGYGVIDLSKVREIVTSRLDDLLAFAAHIRSLLR